MKDLKTNLESAIRRRIRMHDHAYTKIARRPADAEFLISTVMEAFAMTRRDLFERLVNEHIATR